VIAADCSEMRDRSSPGRASDLYSSSSSFSASASALQNTSGTDTRSRSTGAVANSDASEQARISTATLIHKGQRALRQHLEAFVKPVAGMAPATTWPRELDGRLVAMKRSWSVREWLPNAATLTLLRVTTNPHGVVVEAAGLSSARCPACGDDPRRATTATGVR
jgi:hypothetical protein